MSYSFTADQAAALVTAGQNGYYLSVIQRQDADGTLIVTFGSTDLLNQSYTTVAIASSGTMAKYSPVSADS